VPDALRDADTGLLNEAYLRAALPNRVATARRALRPLSIGLMCVDPDAATQTTYALLDTLRESDTACRMDDGSFAVLLEDTPDTGAAWTIERVRRLLSEQGIDSPLWAGVASYPAHALEAEDLMRLAILALHDAQLWESSRIEIALPVN
jgi:GGDEF domain-containing protein